MDNFSKALTFLFLAIGTGIFLMIVMIRVDVFAQKTDAEMKSTAAEMDWQGYLYQQTVQNILTKSGNNQ